MKLYKYFAFAGLSLLLALGSCNDYEDVPVQITTIDYVFDVTDSLGFRSHGYLADMYNLMYNGHNRFKSNWTGTQTNYLESATDNCVSSAIGTDNDIMRLALGIYSAINQVNEEMTTIWSNCYAGIRKANVFIQNIDVVPLMATYTNDKKETFRMNRAWKAEARFLRAYFYFELVKRFGGVTLMGDAIPELNDNMELPRNSFADCVDYIVNELDEIKDSLRVLPLTDQTSFVVTKNAALALKSRVLLYAASPLFNGNSLEPGNELVGYTDVGAAAQRERWEKASQAAGDFIDTYGSKGSNIHALTSDFLSIFLVDYSSANKEVIFVRQGGSDGTVERALGPVGFSKPKALGEGMCGPTQELVDAFPMIDGKSINNSSKDYPYNANSMRMYENRDKRLGYTVLYNGAQWLKTSLALYEGGMNNPSGSAKKTKTGYYARKFMQKAENQEEYSVANHRWILFRYAEILLNFAEAENEAVGPTEEVYQVLRDLRQRVGIRMGRDGNYGLKEEMTKEEMRELVRNERRIELAFEEHRFWDIRRWRIAEEVYKNPLHGISITKDGTQYTFNTIPVLTVTFNSKRYLHPIPYSAVIKNRKMKQNPGWE